MIHQLSLGSVEVVVDLLFDQLQKRVQWLVIYLKAWTSIHTGGVASSVFETTAHCMACFLGRCPLTGSYAASVASAEYCILAFWVQLYPICPVAAPTAQG